MVNDTTIINRFIAFKNPFRYRSYYLDFETNLYYLNSRYYDPELGRFVNADDISNLTPNILNGINLYAYCLNNPVNTSDEDGTLPKWLKKLFGWIVAIFVVVAAAVATVVTAGGFAGAIFAVGSVIAGGAAATLGATIAAGAFIGSVVGFTGYAMFAGIEAIKYNDINMFLEYGDSALVSTVTGGFLGGLDAGLAYRYLNQKGTSDAIMQGGRPNSTYRKVDNKGNVTSVAFYNWRGQQYLRFDYDTHFIKAPYNKAFNPHIHNFDWKFYNNIWRYIETILPF